MFLPKLVFALCGARDWKKKYAGFHFPTFYNFIVDNFEDVENDDLAKTSADELLQWWNRYVYVRYTESGVLIPSLLFSNVFPATDSAASDVNSRRTMQNCRKRLQEARSRRAAHTSARDNAGRPSARDNTGRASTHDNAGHPSARDDAGHASARNDAQ